MRIIIGKITTYKKSIQEVCKAAVQTFEDQATEMRGAGGGGDATATQKPV
jgi:hypothetical protein